MSNTVAPLGNNARPLDNPAEGVPGVVACNDVYEIPVGLIDPDPDQPRFVFDPDAIARLAESLRAFGQIQPITVRPSAREGRFVVVAGERRWRAAMVAGMPHVRAALLGVPPDANPAGLRALQLAENLREALNPIEQAEAFRDLIERHGWSGRQLAQRLQLSQSAVWRALSLLELPEDLREDIASGRVAPRSAQVARRSGKRSASPSRSAVESPNEPNRQGISPKVFATPFGKVTIEPVAPGGFEEIAGAIEAVAKALVAEYGTSDADAEDAG